MAITRATGQAAGTVSDNATSVSLAYPGNVTNGNLISVLVTKFSPSADAFVLGDVSQTAGTATLGTWTLDVSINFNYVDTNYVACAIYSAPVTGTGSCTIQVGGGVAGSYWFLALQEYASANTTGTRVEGTDTATGTTGAPDTGNAVTSAAGAVFAGIVGTVTTGATTHTVGADYTQIAESENGATSMTGHAEDRIVTTSTADTADWVAPTTVKWAAVLAVYKEAGDTPIYQPWTQRGPILAQ